MALGTIATLATIAAAGTSIYAGIEAANRSIPTVDGASSSKKVSDAQAAALPTQLQLQQLMQQGGKGYVDMPAHTREEDFYWVQGGSEWDYNEKTGLFGRAAMGVDPIGGTVLAILGANSDRTIWNQVPKSEWEEGGQFYGQDVPPWGGGKRTVQVAAGPQLVDFSGYGTADIEGTKARKQTDNALTLAQKYGVQFAEQARKEQEQADPLGTKARQMEYDLLKKDMPVSPINAKLNEQITGQVKAGRGFDPMTADLLDKAVAEANASRGGQATAGDISTSMSTGAAGQQRLDAALSKSGSFLQSGQTPEDVAYKRAQQTISNTGSFVNGQTPQSQFGNLANAGNGATPVAQSQTTTGLPNNATQIGTSYANSVNTGNTNQALNGTNSWFAGLSTLLNGISSLNTAKGQ